MLQLVIDEKDRVRLCTALFVGIGVVAAQVFAVVGVGGRKVRSKFLVVSAAPSVCASCLHVFVICCSTSSSAFALHAATRLDQAVAERNEKRYEQ